MDIGYLLQPDPPPSPPVEHFRSTTPSTQTPKTSSNMSTYHSPMQTDESATPTSQAYAHAGGSWSSYPEQGYDSMQAEPRYGGGSSSSSGHHAYRPDSAGYYGHGRRDPGPSPSYHHHGFPQRRGSDGAVRASSSRASDGNSSTAAGSSEDWWNYSKGGESYDDSSRGDIPCTQCGKVFRRQSDLMKHQKYHIKYFSCLYPGCEKAFATQKDLTRHARTHRKGEGYRCMVEGCRKAATGHVYSRKDNYDRHMRTAHPNL